MDQRLLELDPTLSAIPKAALEIPNSFGASWGDYMETHCYVELVMQGEQLHRFGHARSFSSIARDVDGAYQAGSYTEGDYSVYAAERGDDFRQWKKYNHTKSVVHGYLSGFPLLLLQQEDGVQVTPGIHLWTNNSSVFDETYVYPVSQIDGLHVYPTGFLKIMIELDELGMGAEPRYTIPLLKDSKDGTMIERTAHPEDLKRILQEIEEAGIYKVYPWGFLSSGSGGRTNFLPASSHPDKFNELISYE